MPRFSLVRRAPLERRGLRDRLMPSPLWSASGLLIVLGFVLRVLGGVLHRHEVHVLGAAIIALGLLVAVIGWLGEKLRPTKP